MKCKALIPARSGSKRVPDKNIRILDGLPLFVHSCVLALSIPEIEEVYLSTDSKRYGDLAPSYTKVIWRPPELADDYATDFDVVNHALQFFDCDCLVYLRPTSPFRTIEKVRQAIQVIRDAGKNATGLRSVEEMGESAWKCFEIEVGYLKPLAEYMEKANLPNQLVGKTYKANGYVDIVKPECITGRNLWGDKCIAFVTKRIVEIDTIEDLQYAEWLSQKGGNR